MNRYFLTIAIFIILTLSVFAQTPTNIRVTNHPYLNNEEQVCINPTDSTKIVAIWRDFKLGYRQIGVGYSHDGGQSWNQYLIPESQQYDGINSRQSDPALTVDRFGNFHMAVMDFGAFGSVLSFYKSTNNGFSWAGPVPHIAVEDPYTFEDKQFITIDNTEGIYDGNIYCSWARFTDLDNLIRIMFIRSINGGASFEDSILIGPGQTSSACGSVVYDNGNFSIPLVNSNGDVHVFWQAFSLDSGATCTGQYAIKHVVSTDGGASFTYEDTVLTVSGYTQADGGIATYSQPVANADITGGPFDGNMYISFTNQGDEDALTSDVDFIKSTDNGVTWSDRIQINDFEFSEGTNAFHPWMVCNEEGILTCVFYDTRYDYPNNSLFDLSASYSFDGGQTFTTNHRISDVSSSPADLAATPTTKSSLVEPMAGLLAEYIGVTAFHDKINAVWTDSRDGNSEVYTANWYLPFLQPRLVNPLAGISFNMPPTFKWSTCWKNNDDRYRFEISSTSDFSSDVTEIILDTNCLVTDSMLAVGEYYWRVKAFRISLGDSTAYSETESFSIDAYAVGCCEGSRGNFDMASSQDVDIVDLLFIVDYMFLPPGEAPAPTCLEEADIVIDNNIDISDLLLLVGYMFLPPPALTLPDCPGSAIYSYIGNDTFSDFGGWFNLIDNGIGELTGEWQLPPCFEPDLTKHVYQTGAITGTILEMADGTDFYPIELIFETDNIEKYQAFTGQYYIDSMVGTWNFYDSTFLLNQGTFKATLK